MERSPVIRRCNRRAFNIENASTYLSRSLKIIICFTEQSQDQYLQAQKSCIAHLTEHSGRP